RDAGRHRPGGPRPQAVLTDLRPRRPQDSAVRRGAGAAAPLAWCCPTFAATQREDERDVGPAQTKIGQRTLVDGVELGGGALSAAPRREPADQRASRPRDDGGEKPPRAKQRGGTRRPGTKQQLLEVGTGEPREIDSRREGIERPAGGLGCKETLGKAIMHRGHGGARGRR